MIFVLWSRSMKIEKTETSLVTERLEAVRRELKALTAEALELEMTLKVLRSLKMRGATDEASPKVEAAIATSGAEKSLAEMILDALARRRDGMTTAEVVVAVQGVAKDAKYGSVVSVISRLVNTTGTVRRDAKKRLFLKKEGESPSSANAEASSLQPSPSPGTAAVGVRRRAVTRRSA